MRGYVLSEDTIIEESQGVSAIHPLFDAVPISVLFVSEKSNLGLAALHYFGGCAERSNARYVSPEGAAKYHEILTMLFHFSCPKSLPVNGLLEVYFS